MKRILSKLLSRKAKLDCEQNDSSRPAVIVHNHIFKNAGSSIDWALKNNFGKGFVDHRDDESMRTGAGYLGTYLTDNQDIQAISSHHLMLPLPELDITKLLHLMMFRHPIERVTSVYSYERKQTGARTPGAVHAKKLSLKDYILWRMRPDVGGTIRNFHVTRSIPPREIKRVPISEEELQLAIKLTGSVALLGLVERFDESMVLFEETLRQFFPSIDLSYKMQNINQDKRITQQERVEKLHQEIGDEVYQLLLQNNEKDLSLYTYVEEEFHNRIINIPDLPSRLVDFHERCTAKH